MTDDFHKTPMGRRFYEVDIPKLVTNLGRIADKLDDKLTEEGKNLLKRYLHFMAGFEESSIYDDYKENDTLEPKFTDEEYADARDLIRRLTK